MGRIFCASVALAWAAVAAPANAQQTTAINLGMDAFDRGDYLNARPYFVQACDGGDSLGCHNLAYLYDVGLGVPVDYPRAAALYRKACDGGTADGCTGLGVLTENGRGVELDLSRASRLYKQGCDGRDPYGCYNLGGCYEDGIGVGRDPRKALDLYRKALSLSPPDDLRPKIEAAIRELSQ